MRLSIFPFVVLTALMLTSCEKDDPVDPGAISVDQQLEFDAPRGETAQVVSTIIAEDGIREIMVSSLYGDENVDVPADATELTVSFEFPVPADAILGTIYPIDITVTDEDGDQFSITKNVVTAPLIQEPANYSFERNGESTVSYSGQNERLDMVSAMKGYLSQADGGQMIDPQVLLDAYENVGGNGNGLFDFNSSKQLKDKTFAPDLDEQFFESLFQAAADASQQGVNGVMAENGQAGLLIRENNGNTVLVDANGREFTQLIEKGLMGSVMYSQIYNTYLTDTRIGDDVENTELVEGKSYTSMEHHWDEAFGYWNPPLDFTSNWPADRASEDRFWSHYSNTVDPLLGTNDLIMNAFKEGRTAIVNNDLEGKNAQRDVLYEKLELVAAAVAVHYINATLSSLNDGKTGEAFHTLSEAWAFTNALKYSPNRSMSIEDIELVKETHFGADGNFWNVTPAGLNTAKEIIVTNYPDLANVQDQL